MTRETQDWKTFSRDIQRNTAADLSQIIPNHQPSNQQGFVSEFVQNAALLHQMPVYCPCHLSRNTVTRTCMLCYTSRHCTCTRGGGR